MKWSKEQLDIIRFPKGNLLVSAAAGSGKTAVLMGHIMQRLTNVEKPVDVDRFLIVTFTKAAAQEMKDRLHKTIFEEASQREENAHLRKQLKLLQRAEISTIDSFCSRVLQGHFAEIDLDPSFRIGDQSEIALLKDDVLNALLEEEYVKRTEAFLDLSEALSPEKEDKKLQEIILEIQRASESQVDPEVFFTRCENNYEIDNEEDLEKAPFYSYYLKSSAETILSTQDILLELQQDRNRIKELFRLVRLFNQNLLAAKKKGRVFDFSDISHFALQILQKEGKPTETAKKMAEYYEEILIDEYQDSNDLQEAILTSVSKEIFGTPNIVMVGDMKQSIYRFRNARPELFVQKYDTYEEKEGAIRRKIELHTNYRSKPAVIAGVNDIFYQLMHKEVGNIEYDDQVALHVSPDNQNKDSDDKDPSKMAELVLLQGPKKTDEDITKEQKEVRYLASRILELTDPKTGFDVHDKNGVRKAKYSDIAILFRSVTGWEEVISDEFNQLNIPFSLGGSKGFFDTWEIRLIINLLTIIDNALNEIPLVAVLHSFLFNFSDEDLANLAIFRKKSNNPKKSFFQILKEYEENNEIQEKIQYFLNKLMLYRKKATLLNLEGLITFIYDDLRLLELVGAMPEGVRRAANLEALIHRAGEFEKTNYQGIFQFIRYIEQKKKEADRDESEVVFEDDNVVRIMTIHKSKGLEFPIVFLAGTGKKMNHFDSQKEPLIDADLGIALQTVDLKRRTKNKTAIFYGLQQKIKTDSIGEELRVLYVALTRAEEKIIITGCTDFKEEEIEQIESREGIEDVNLVEELTSVVRLLDVLWKCALKCPNLMTYFPECELREASSSKESLSVEGRKEERLEKGVFSKLEENRLTIDLSQIQEMKEQLAFDYHEDDLYQVLQTLSVSYLKALFVSNGEAFGKEYAKETSLVEDLSMEESKTINGARLGTLYHMVMEQLGPTEAAPVLLERLRKEGLILPEEKDKINPYKIESFRKSSLAKRFFEAKEKEQGFREKQFIIGVPVCEIYPNLKIRDKKELVMIQGIIDMYFEEADGLVLVDYKTDRLKEEKEYINRYKTQLDFYEKALTQITGRPVKEKWIYSFALEKGIRL